MLDASPAPLPFTCTKCGGSGQFRSYGRCGECKGKGGFRTSPEARAKAKDAAKVRRIRDARAENQIDAGLYLSVIRLSGRSAFLASLRRLDVIGSVWTPTQKVTARATIAALDGQGWSQ